MAFGLRVENIPFLLKCLNPLVEKVGELGSHTASGTIMGLTLTAALPVAALVPPIIEQAAKFYEQREHRDALIEAFRESLLAAVRVSETLASQQLTCAEADRNILQLLLDGLEVSTKSDLSGSGYYRILFPIWCSHW